MNEGRFVEDEIVNKLIKRDDNINPSLQML